MHGAVLTATLEGKAASRQGKVRDIFNLGDRLLMVSTDRISAFDWILPTGIPDKGRVLTQISRFWFEMLGIPHHLITTSLDGVSLPDSVDRNVLDGRSMVVKKADVVQIECVVRGYLEGSAWREYQQDNSVCGIELPAGLKQCDQLPEPIFTPATKEDSGHDVNISFRQMVEIIGADTAERLRQLSLDVYQKGVEHAIQHGIVIADTKFEWGWCDGELILVDEVLTPDSSRFWPADEYEPGHSQPSFDKQYVREWLDGTDWDKDSDPPSLPEEVVFNTRRKYVEAYEQLTGLEFS
ncbi:MAG TPA: phosphoribosylaminoimidazolesuccinocarboxamide synthase [Planctomycetes bacterium]|nr:phosphoribosylaminoimidazolesuccinocarboxamide synthase [Planctomycetaceae bacterium]HIK94114.1 phosphoribosylaminoimidazolesuccinocarboxamide synthase [Planctomycetota bacterium]